MLKETPMFAEVHLAAAFDESDLLGGQLTLRRIDEAQGMANVSGELTRT